MWGNLLVSEIHINDIFILVPVNMMSRYENLFYHISSVDLDHMVI